MSLKENRVCIMARPEDTYGVDSIQAALELWESDSTNPHPATTDAILGYGVDIQADTTALARQNYNPSLSPEASGVARVLSRFIFKTELRASGVLGTAPRIGRLFKGCNMAETTVSSGAASQIANPVLGPNSLSVGIANAMASIVKTTAPTSRYDTYRLYVTTAGDKTATRVIVTGIGFPELDGTVMDGPDSWANVGSAAGVVTLGGTISAPTFTFSGTWKENDFVELFIGGTRFYQQFNVGDTVDIVGGRFQVAIVADARFVGSTYATSVVTIVLAGAAAPRNLSSAITLGASAAVITPTNTWTGNTVLGESILIGLRRVSVRYDPVSDAGSSLSIWMFLDGALFKITGARGTWSATGEAAKYGEITWNFTGNYHDPVDRALPTNLQYETSTPFKIEVAQLALYGLGTGLNACATKFSFDMANTVTPRDCINADGAYDGVQITARAPTAGCDPEAVLPSVFNPWARMRAGDATRIHACAGAKGGAGNTVRLQANNAHYTGVPFAARNNIRAYDLGFNLARVSSVGDDEISVVFG